MSMTLLCGYAESIKLFEDLMFKAVLLRMLQLSRCLKLNVIYRANVRNLKTHGFFYPTKCNFRYKH